MQMSVAEAIEAKENIRPILKEVMRAGGVIEAVIGGNGNLKAAYRRWPKAKSGQLKEKKPENRLIKRRKRGVACVNRNGSRQLALQPASNIGGWQLKCQLICISAS